MKIIACKYLLLLLILFVPCRILAFPSGSGTAVIDQYYASIDSMKNRTKNFESGPYTVSSNSPYYLANQVIEITIAGPTFTGILFTVIDEQGNNVGTFTEVANMVGEFPGTSAKVITHQSNFGSVMSYTLLWAPPATNVGKVYVIGYILAGTRGVISSQQFYRFVRDDNSAISISSDVMLKNGFE